MRAILLTLLAILLGVTSAQTVERSLICSQSILDEDELVAIEFSTDTSKPDSIDWTITVFSQYEVPIRARGWVDYTEDNTEGVIIEWGENEVTFSNFDVYVDEFDPEEELFMQEIRMPMDYESVVILLSYSGLVRITVDGHNYNVDFTFKESIRSQFLNEFYMECTDQNSSPI